MPYTFTVESSKPLYVDFETQSILNLRECGAKVYIESPLTRIMSGVFYDRKNVHIWLPSYTRAQFSLDLLFEEFNHDTTIPDKLYDLDYHLYVDDELPAAIKKLCRTHTLTAHNAEMFDAWLFDTKCPGIKVKWKDTIHGCRYAGIPAGLDNALKSIGDSGKGDSASMHILTKVKIGKNGTLVYPVGTSNIWVDLVKYNILDTVKLEILDDWLENDHYSKEPKLVEVHSRINMNGFNINRSNTKHLRNVWNELQNNSMDVIEEITKGELKYNAVTGKHDIASPQKVKAWLLSKGFTLPGDSLNQQTVQKIIERPDLYTGGMADDDAETIIAVLAERRNAVRSTVGKLDRILQETDEYGKVRNWCVLHGAGPGRFSGRGIQPHNFPRGVKLKKGLDLTQLVDLLLENKLELSHIKQSAIDNSSDKVKISISDVASTLTRSLIQPHKGNRFNIFDYSNIEARGVAWLFGCNTMLNVFGNPKLDIYCDMASKLYGRIITPENEDERFVGKQIVLGCGYQMWWKKFAIMCALYGIDLQKAGVTAEQCVRAYRKAYPEITAGWKLLHNTSIAATKTPGVKFNVAKCIMHSTGDFLIIQLPSGRSIRYRNPRIGYGHPPWSDVEIVEQLEYQSPHGYFKKLYGGIITENIVQGIARDLLCHALVTIKSATPVLHVHDEIVNESSLRSNKLKVLNNIGKEMSTPPQWASDFPLGVEGYTGRVYTKGKLKGEISVNYLAGKLIA